MTMTPGSEIVTTQHVTTHGSDDPEQVGTVTTAAPGTGWAPVETVPEDGSSPGRNRDHGPDGTGSGTGTAPEGPAGSTVPAEESGRTWFRLGRRRRENRGHVTMEPGGHVTTVPVPVAPVPVEPVAAPVAVEPAASAPQATVEPDNAQSDAGTDAGEKKEKKSRDWNNVALWTVIWALTAVTTWMASSGQIDAWTWAGLKTDDPRRFGVPFVMELSVIGWLLIGAYAVSQKRSPYPWWWVAAGFSGVAVFLNAAHGNWKSGLIFGTASAASLAFWFAKFYLSYIGSEVGKGLRTGTKPKPLGLASIWQIRVDFRAFLIVQRREQVKTVERARELAELWIWVYQDTKANPAYRKTFLKWSRANRRTAKRTAWMTVNRDCGVKVIVPKSIEVAEVTFAPPAPVELPPAPPAPPAQVATQVPAAPRPPVTRVPDGTPPPVSAPPAPAVLTGPQVPDVPEELFEHYTDKIAQVQAKAGNLWWAGEKPLTVDDVQKKYGIGNRSDASQVAKCLKVLRARRLADEALAANSEPAGAEGGTDR